jgi:hypothetical protein
MVCGGWAMKIVVIVLAAVLVLAGYGIGTSLYHKSRVTSKARVGEQWMVALQQRFPTASVELRPAYQHPFVLLNVKNVDGATRNEMQDRLTAFKAEQKTEEQVQLRFLDQNGDATAVFDF